MKIFNTLTRNKETFVPIEPGKVSIYVCGPTVYNYFHIGNARTFLFFDVVRRYLAYRGYNVHYVQNLTDIDDKLINQSIAEEIPVAEIAKKYIAAFFEDAAALGIQPADESPKATQYIGKMIGLIQEMEASGHAYEANGDVYFSVESIKDYGTLSGKKIDDLQAGARVEANTQKRHPADFTLWKAAKPGEPKWKSPWGEGRPGWHTECVVMSRDLLGKQFDIHAGAIDLIFPHHENEVAQAKATTGQNHARYWMHGGFLNIEGEKMSKSLDNFFLARDILQQYDAEAIRFFFLSKHYRSPIDFSREIIHESAQAVKNFYSALEDIDYLSIKSAEYTLDAEQQDLIAQFNEAMDDDFNTARAIAVLFEAAKQAKNQSHSLTDRQNYAHALVEMGQALGFFMHLDEKLTTNLNETAEQLIELFISYRSQAKKDKNWAMADGIRDDLKKLGIQLKDTPTGTQWKVEK
jgi:cysteinyl-tRNA synthetase